MKVRASISKLQVYSPPIEAREEEGLLLLDFNESTIPPSKHVLEALHAAVDSASLQRYPAYGDLPQRLAEYIGVSVAQVLLTNGCDSAIQRVCTALLREGDEAIFPQPSFFVIESSILATGAKLNAPAYTGKDMGFPIEAMLAAITPKTKLIAVVNPNNPTGTLAKVAQIEVLLKAAPHAAVMVDETYFEFCGVSVLGLLPKYDNLIVLRSFSKAMGIAGLRLGCAVSNPAFIQELYKLRIPYDVNRMAAAAGRALLLHLEPWQAYVREVMEEAKPMVEQFFSQSAVPYVKGAANFMLVRPHNVNQALQVLQEQGVLVRPQAKLIQGWLRVSMGTVEKMKRFVDAYRHVLAAQAS